MKNKEEFLKSHLKEIKDVKKYKSVEELVKVTKDIGYNLGFIEGVNVMSDEFQKSLDKYIEEFKKSPELLLKMGL